MNKNHYTPGVCNIGAEEITKRRTFGWIGLFVIIVIWELFFIYHTPAAWRLFLFIPAAASASGFIQAFLHFCANFGINGFYNFTKDAGKNDSVSQAEYRKKDREKAIQIIIWSTAIGIIVAAMGFLLA
jgi:hypothetical protein